MNENKRDKLVLDLATLIYRAPMIRLVSPATSSGFRSLPDGQRKKLGGDLQYPVFESCLKGSLDLNPEFGLVITCDLSEQYSAGCLKLFHKIRMQDPDARKRLLGIHFADDKSHAGLQAADMVVYCARADATRDVIERHLIVAEIIGMFHSQLQAEGQFTYTLEGSGLGDGVMEMKTSRG